MWPWAHAAVGYLCYSVGVRAVRRRSPAGWPALAAAFGTQFPDLVDKPLAWTFRLLPNGRSLAHSLLTATLVVAVVAVVLRRRGRGDVAVAFGVGYLSHLLTDLPGAVLRGDFSRATYLLWPLTPPVDHATPPSLLSHLRAIEFDALFPVRLAVVGVVGLLWLADGAPGLAEVRRTLGRVVR